MREIITIGIGNFGNNVTTAFYEQLARQHQIDSLKNDDNTDLTARYSDSDPRKCGFLSVHFNQELTKGTSSINKYSNRAILLDMDPDSVDRARASTLGHMYRQENLHQLKVSSRGNWAVGNYTDGKELSEKTMDSFRMELQSLQNPPECFLINSGIEGGTGGGVMSQLITDITEIRPDVISVCNILFGHPSCRTGVTSAYNSVLSMHRLVECSTMVNMLDNNAITSKIKSAKTNRNGTYDQINSEIASFMGSLTAPARFYSTLGTSMRKIATNVIPFPRLHFLGVNSFKSGRASTSASTLLEPTFRNHQIMCSYNIADPRILAGCTLFCGNFSNFQAQEAVQKVNNSADVPFMEWIPCCFLNSVTSTPWRGGGVLLNSMANNSVFKRMGEEFTAMFRRKAFLHWYTAQGMDEMEFTEAQSNLNDLLSEYQPPSPDYGYEDDYQEQYFEQGM